MSNMIKSGIQHLLKVTTKILWSTFLTVFLLSTMVSAKVELLDKIVAIVNNSAIMQSELNSRLRHIEQNMHNQGVKAPPSDALKKHVLEFMIAEELQFQQAKKQGVNISAEELNEAVQDLAKKNNLSLSQFKESLKVDHVTLDQVKAQLYREMMIAHVQEMSVIKKIHISEQEIKRYLDSPQGEKHQQYHFAHILIAVPQNASADETGRIEQKAKTIYDELSKNPDDFGNIAIKESAGQFALKGGDLGWRSSDQLPDLFLEAAKGLQVGQITKPIKNSSGFHIIKLIGIKSSQHHIQTLYHVRHILIAPNEIRSSIEAHGLANKIYRMLRSGEDFSKLARSYSDDKNSSLNGGDLAWIATDTLDPHFAKEVTTLPINTISHPVRTAFGWHIIEVLGKKKEDVSEKLQKEQVREILTKRKFEEQLPIWIDNLKRAAYIKINL
ncbi:MAG: peptidylprolyl isomerase [Endozoicomonadaceae bacterium]|nr:peptidylprolyl isomerase [Endozoicomonadaceae bacterium]